MPGTDCRPASRVREALVVRQDEETWLFLQSGSTNRRDEVGLHGLHGLDGAGDEGGLGFRDRVIHGDAGTFIQDLDAEDLADGHGAVFVGSAEGDIEGQDLVAIAGGGQGPHAVDVGDLVVQSQLCSYSLHSLVTLVFFWPPGSDRRHRNI